MILKKYKNTFDFFCQHKFQSKGSDDPFFQYKHHINYNDLPYEVDIYYKLYKISIE